MKVRVTRAAAGHIERISAHLDAASPAGARKVGNRLIAAFRLLERQPFAGRQTDRRSVRRLTLVPYPYVIFYRVDPDAVLVLAVRHAARRPHLS